MDVIVLLYFYSIYSFDYLKIEHDTRVVFVCDNNCCVGFKNFSFEIIFNLQTNSFDFFKEYVGDQLFDCLS